MENYIPIEDLQESMSTLVPTPVEAESQEVMDFEDLLSSWFTATAVENCCKWTLGDIVLEAVRAAKKADPEIPESTAMKSFAESTGSKLSSIRSYAWVSQAFPDKHSRNTGLTWSHYRATVATKDPDMWVRVAINEHLTVSALEQRIKEDSGEYMLPAACCTQCRAALEQTTTITVYRNGRKEASLCSDECALEYFATVINDKTAALTSYNTNGSIDNVRKTSPDNVLDEVNIFA